MSILPSRLRTLVAALPLVAALGGCYSWSRQPVPSPEPDRYLGKPVRVTRADGVRMTLVGVRIDRDSLFGNQEAKPHGRVAIPLSQVRKVEARHVDPFETVALTALSTAAAFAFVATVLVRSECSCVSPP